MSKPKKISAEDIMKALNTLYACSQDALEEAVLMNMDGVDDRLDHVKDTANFLHALSHAVMLDIDAVAYGESKEAYRSEEPHRGLMFAQAFHTGALATCAAAFGAKVEEAHDRCHDIERILKACPESMTEEQYDKACSDTF